MRRDFCALHSFHLLFLLLEIAFVFEVRLHAASLFASQRIDVHNPLTRTLRAAVAPLGARAVVPTARTQSLADPRHQIIDREFRPFQQLRAGQGRRAR